MTKWMWLGIFAAGLLDLGAVGATPLITDDEARLPPPNVLVCRANVPTLP